MFQSIDFDADGKILPGELFAFFYQFNNSIRIVILISYGIGIVSMKIKTMPGLARQVGFCPPSDPGLIIWSAARLLLIESLCYLQSSLVTTVHHASITGRLISPRKPKPRQSTLEGSGN